MRPQVPLAVFRPTSFISLSSRRALSTTQRLRIKEDAERSPEEIENKKQEQIKKQQKGEGHWHEELASHGESNIAADKEEVHDHDSHMSKLQEETKKKGEKGEL